MKYKVLALDFDGTTLRSDGTVSERTVKAIKKFKELGGKAFLCTGRIFPSIKPEAEKSGLTGEVYCYQGAALYDVSTGVRKNHIPVPNKYVNDICTYFEERGVYFQTYFDDVVFCEKFTQEGDDYFANYTGNGGRYATKVPLSVYFAKHPEARATKFLAISNPDKVNAMMSELSEKFDGMLNVMCSNPTYLEIVAYRAGKGNAILSYCKANGFDPSEVVAFGDSINDIQMLKTAGVGVAVENARAELKEVADYITLSNDEDGVARVIEMIIEDKFDVGK